MGSFRPRSAPAAVPSQRQPRYAKVGCEQLEPRHMMATLGMGINLFADNGGVPGAEIETVTVGQSFFVDVLVEDQRTGATPVGVIGLPVNLFWDVTKLELLAAPSDPLSNDFLTGRFPLNRAFTTYREDGPGHTGVPSPLNEIPPDADANVQDLRGGSLPANGQGQVIGIDEPGVGADQDFRFSRLHFRAIAAADITPFSIEVTGSMSFADADPLDQTNPVNTLIANKRDLPAGYQQAVDNDEELAVTEFIRIEAAPASLSGFVYLDINTMNFQLDRDASDALVEFGLPGVTITLFIDTQLIAETITGADGSYRFEDLDEGVYRVVETQPARFISTGSSVGFVMPGDATRGVSVNANEIAEIRLALGNDGFEYNFGEIPIPDKRFFLSSTAIRELVSEQNGVPAATIRGNDNGVAETIRVEAFDDGYDVTVGNGPTETIPLAKARVLFIETDDGEDTVELVGTPGSETVASETGSATMRLGDNYEDVNFALMAVAAKQVVFDGNGGSEDLAILRDGPVNDALVGTGSNAKLSATGRSVELDDFDRVRAVAVNRSVGTDTDTVDQGSIDYLLNTVGDWDLI